MSRDAEVERSFEGAFPPPWHAIVCAEFCERAVGKAVERMGFETLVPLRHAEVAQKKGKVWRPELVIPGYCFARFWQYQDWPKITRIRGVEGLLSYPGEGGDMVPIRIPEAHMRLPVGCHRVFAYVELVGWLTKRGLLERYTGPSGRLSKRERKRLAHENKLKRLEMLYGT